MTSRAIRSCFLLLAGLGLLPAATAGSQTVSFDFDTGTPRLSPGAGLPIDQTSGGVTARFSAASTATFSVQSDASTGWKMSLFSGNYLSQNSLTKGSLDIKFSEPVTRVSITFATADFHQMEVPSTVQLTAYNDSTSTPAVGSATAHGTYGGDTMPVGTLVFASSGRPFNLVEISIPYQPLSSGVLLVDNVAVTLSFRCVSAATFQPDSALAPGSIASVFGQNFAQTAISAAMTPLPTSLGGVTVSVKDSAARELPAGLFFVSPGQVNFLVPTETALGPAMVTVASQGTVVASGLVQLDAVAPGLFTANASGTGVAAGLAVRIAPSGSQTTKFVFQCQGGTCVPDPVDLGGAGDDTILALFGTGIRGRDPKAAVSVMIGGVQADVLYAGPQGEYDGLDQVNVRVPRIVAGRGDAGIVVTAGGKPSNTVTAQFF